MESPPAQKQSRWKVQTRSMDHLWKSNWSLVFRLKLVDLKMVAGVLTKGANASWQVAGNAATNKFCSSQCLPTDVEMQRFALGSWLVVVSGVLAMSTILHALIASVKGAGTLTGEFHYLINGLACLLYCKAEILLLKIFQRIDTFLQAWRGKGSAHTSVQPQCSGT